MTRVIRSRRGMLSMLALAWFGLAGCAATEQASPLAGPTGVTLPSQTADAALVAEPAPGQYNQMSYRPLQSAYSSAGYNSAKCVGGC